MSIKTLYANLLNAANQVTPFGIAKLLAPIVQNALVHGQVRIKELNVIRNMTSPSVKPLQVALGKFLPISWDKDNNTYKFSRPKADKLTAEIGTDLLTLQSHILSTLAPTFTAEELAEKEEAAKNKAVNAWNDKQIETQVKRLEAMDIDQLRLQMKAYEKMMNIASSRLAIRAGEALRSKAC
jgi:hypothetical protein